MAIQNSDLPGGRLNGKPPADHPRRCTVIRKCGRQCERWALRGSRACQFHGGRRTNYVVNRVGRFYKRSLTQALQAVIDEHLDEKPDDQLTLFTELALMREVAGQHVKLYGAALELGKQESVMAAAELMAMSLQRVSDLCTAAARIHQEQRDKYSSHDLNYVIEQIIRISWDCFRDHPKLHEFAVKLREHVSLSEAQGTTITADQRVLDMDKATANDV